MLFCLLDLNLELYKTDSNEASVGGDAVDEGEVVVNLDAETTAGLRALGGFSCMNHHCVFQVSVEHLQSKLSDLSHKCCQSLKSWNNTAYIH